MTRSLLSCLALLALASPSRAATEMVVGPQTINPLDISTVTTGGTAVTALGPGEHSAGGFIQNPPTATIALCINEAGVAVVAGSGSTTCISPGNVYQLAPSNGPVSVVSSDSAHPYSGYGLR